MSCCCCCLTIHLHCMACRPMEPLHLDLYILTAFTAFIDEPDTFNSWSYLIKYFYISADKTVQYKLCVPLIPKRECEPGDLAVTVGTNTGEWSPHVKEARCACPDNMYQLLGWWRHPTQKHDNKTGLWVYEYFCEKV